MSSKPSYEELERDHAFLFAAYKELKKEHEELSDEFLKLDALVTYINQVSGSYLQAKLDSVPEGLEEVED